VDSYHEGYEWSDGITKGINSVLKNTDAELKIFRMDTKRNISTNFMRESAIKAKALIESFKPDIVIASDDNAAKYLIRPFYKDASLPVVFCGINWDSSIYGFPCKNITGMLEIASVPKLLDYLKPFAKGSKIGYLAADVLTARKEGFHYRTVFNLDMNELYVKNFSEWETAYSEIQNDCDILIIGNNAGINDWDKEAANRIVTEKTKVPTGALYDFMSKYALIGYTKVAEEQGEWAATTALKVLQGADISTIPIVSNKKGNLIVNTRIARDMNIKLPDSLIQTANQVIEN
jgi:ABC-type uncharacterized transport system substrate-binding protein